MSESRKPSAAIQATLTAIETVARDTNLYTFARADGAALPAADAGAHIILQLPNRLVRQYSLLHPDPAPTHYTIGVKRDAASRGGSAFLHDTIQIGDQLRILPPRNLFALDETAADTVLFAGGIGITPIYAMRRRLNQLGRNPTLHFAARSRADMAFLQELAADPRAKLHFDDEAGRPLDIPAQLKSVPREAHIYCCGPAPMLAAFEAAVAADGRAPERVHVEYFKPKD